MRRSSLVFGSMLVACAAAHEPASVRLGGDVVAIVDGEAITRDEIRSEMRAHGRTAREALDVLERETLLAHEARRLGMVAVGTAPSRRALAQAMLFELERTHGPGTISDEAVRQAFAGEARALSHGEQRGVRHLLVRPQSGGPVPEAVARAFTAEAISTLSSQGTSDAVWQSLRERAASHPEISVLVESIAPFARDAAFEAPFVEAAFAEPAVGVVQTPVRTSYGFHAILVTSVVPAYTATLEQDGPRIRAALVVAARERALARLFESLARSHGVSVRAHAIDRALALDIPQAEP